MLDVQNITKRRASFFFQTSVTYNNEDDNSNNNKKFYNQIHMTILKFDTFLSHFITDCGYAVRITLY